MLVLQRHSCLRFSAATLIASSFVVSSTNQVVCVASISTVQASQQGRYDRSFPPPSTRSVPPSSSAARRSTLERVGAEYHQFCPIAKAMELLDERWTLLVVRELVAGSKHFNGLRRGLPRMSPSLLQSA